LSGADKEKTAVGVAHRFAELVGRGLTQHEAARVVEIGTRTGERLMTKPEIRQIVEETRAARSGMGNGDPCDLGTPQGH
jgi:hypothetical protein